MGKTTLETKTNGLTQGSSKKSRIEPTNTLTANGIHLQCSSCGILRLDAHQASREEQSPSQLYQNIKTKLIEFYYGFKLKLTNISRYLPQ